MSEVVHIIFSSVWVAEWPPFGKELPTRLTTCSHCGLTILGSSRLGFEGEMWVYLLHLGKLVAYVNKNNLQTT